MKSSLKTEKFKEIQRKIRDSLQDPNRLRIVILMMIAIAGIGALGLPMQGNITTLQKEFVDEMERQALIKDYNNVKKQLSQYRKRVAKDADLNWWVEHVINISRESKLKVVEFKPFKIKGSQARVKKLQGTFLKFDLRGSYGDVLNFIGRLENQKYGVRITRISLQKESEIAELKATVTLGVLAKKEVKMSKQGGVAEPGLKKEKETEDQISPKSPQVEGDNLESQPKDIQPEDKEGKEDQGGQEGNEP